MERGEGKCLLTSLLHQSIQIYKVRLFLQLSQYCLFQEMSVTFSSKQLSEVHMPVVGRAKVGTAKNADCTFLLFLHALNPSRQAEGTIGVQGHIPDRQKPRGCKAGHRRLHS